MVSVALFMDVYQSANAGQIAPVQTSGAIPSSVIRNPCTTFFGNLPQLAVQGFIIQNDFLIGMFVSYKK